MQWALPWSWIGLPLPGLQTRTSCCRHPPVSHASNIQGQSKQNKHRVMPPLLVASFKAHGTHTRLLFPFPSSTKFLVYPRLSSPRANLDHSLGSES
jgi:hypothetical protein